MTAKSYDFAIVGGGMAGLTMALLLAPVLTRFKKTLVLIEAFNPNAGQYQPSFDARSTALSEGTRQILEEMGIWPSIAQQVCPINKIHVSQKGGFGATRIYADDVDVNALGYVVENGWLGHQLMAAVDDLDCISWLAPARVQAVATTAYGSRLTLEDGAEIETGFLMVADGAQSSLRAMLGIHAEKTPYHQHALVCNVETRLPHQNVAYERFTPNGPLALLPLTEHRSALIWSVPEAQVEGRMAMSEREFKSLLELEFGTRLGPIVKVGERASYPLNLMLVSDQVQPGVVLLGNSAHALHPVAGQGFNLIIRDLVCLSQSIETRLESQLSLLKLEWLTDYQQHRYMDQWLTTSFSHWLIELFSNDHKWLTRMRELGLIALDCVAPAKSTFARQAMGMGLGSAN